LNFKQIGKCGSESKKFIFDKCKVMSFSIRPAKYQDLDSIVILFVETTKLISELSPEGFGKALKSPIDMVKESESFGKALDDIGTVILVAEQDEKVLGFVMGVIENQSDDLLDAPFITIQYICVAEKYQRSGIGKALIQEVEKLANNKGLTTLESLVWQNNRSSKALFQSLGFLPLEIRMAKRLRQK
jgi:ribosomal protein S18 acetylase RimI-like enzyme